MNRLFVRIWLANWGVFASVVFISVLVFHQYVERDMREKFQNPPISHAQLSRDLQLSLAKGESLEHWVKRFEKLHQSVFLITSDGEDLLERDIPVIVLRRMSSFRSLNQLHEDRVIRIEGYPPFHLVSVPPRPKMPFTLFSPLILVLIAFLASGLASVILARFITFPIQQLNLASDRVAKGDFQTNVAATVGARKDEIAELARRFDSMAKALDGEQTKQQNLLRDVSHELRSPLARLLLISDMLDDANGKELDTLQTRLKKELSHMDVLIDEVMALARLDIEAGTQALEYLELGTVLQPLIDDAIFEANAVNKSIVFHPSEQDLSVKMRPDHLIRAIENIIRNAIRHTPPDSQIEIRIAKEGNLAKLYISDEGEGVDESELKNIFAPFYRSSTARARFKGAGIGLAIAEHIIKSHSGEIIAKNTTPPGLSVCIALPC
ncbi:Sensor protein PfeS [Thalassocella blandensis]|nr:Sensor protein PfeS [Thalassocella blandensis]